MVLGVLTGWLDRQEREAVAYLIEENRLLRRQLRTRRLRLTDDDRRRLAARAYRVMVFLEIDDVPACHLLSMLTCDGDLSRIPVVTYTTTRENREHEDSIPELNR